jgi:hypothetical protein
VSTATSRTVTICAIVLLTVAWTGLAAADGGPWGAVSLGGTHLGGYTDAGSAAEASRQAQLICVDDGGVGCSVATTFSGHGMCAVVVRSVDGKLAWGVGRGQLAAGQVALAKLARSYKIVAYCNK